MDLREIVGVRIRQLRVAAGLSQEELADLIGKNPTAISQMERAVFAPSLETIEELANALKVPPSSFFPEKSAGRGTKKRDSAIGELIAIALGLKLYDISTLIILAKGLHDQEQSAARKTKK